MKRKYFKDPQEHNLLTWETKEQIRYLHQEFPEDWTVEKLAQSFPISKDGICKLLKSSYVIKTPEKILKHDLNVQQKWKELEAELSRKGGPIHPQYKMLVDSGKLDLMKNAATLKGAPKKILQLDCEKTEAPKIGIFSSIYLDNIGEQQNKRKEVNKLELKKFLEEANKLELKKFLETIDLQQKNFKHVPESSSDRTSEESKMLSTLERPVTELHEMPHSIRRRHKSEIKFTDNCSYLETYQMMGTGKVVNVESDVKNENVKENVFTEHEIGKYSKYSVQTKIRQNVINLKHQSWNSSFQTQIRIPKNVKHKKGVMYKMNDVYYDENGEILYRAPFK